MFMTTKFFAKEQGDNSNLVYSYCEICFHVDLIHEHNRDSGWSVQIFNWSKRKVSCPKIFTTVPPTIYYLLLITWIIVVMSFPPRER